ncbi:MAG: hypothetical protein ACI8WB_000193 [Phenylobacterium sp.]|jgi:hypothetical protein
MINKKIMPCLTSLLLSCALVGSCYAGEDDAEETYEQSDNAKEQQQMEYEMLIVVGGGDDGLKPPQ